MSVLPPIWLEIRDKEDFLIGQTAKPIHRWRDASSAQRCSVFGTDSLRINPRALRLH
jgi:hypothetical protein